ncbi:phage-related minor tail protein [Nitrospirillum viridazoti Y2]|uniref:Bacteriophage tail tape measure N-terminal domain-containing protein n=1 Tax=Nitrospirillum amazonense TaxID=28077 RepID=A0A560IHZ9_9PROT|nr:phage tail length tape measure family protein [Nitrospirillum amazonense]EGY02281.1 phage-related minor tail protein [Nitrospirillum amazonense Y2]TWB58678.1 hypothetical protein FBZ92_109171 [Nitrospirillum amazonense]
MVATVNVSFSADVSEFIAGLEKMDDRTAQSTAFQQKHADELDKVAASLGALRASVDPVYDANQRLARAQDLVNAGLKTGLINEQQAQDVMGRVNRQLDVQGQETERLAASLGSLRASVDSVYAAEQRLVRAQEVVNAGLKAGLINQAQARDIMWQVREGLEGQAAGAVTAAAGHEKFSLATAGARRELIVLGHELSQGNVSRFGGSLMVLAERAGGVTLGMMGLAAVIAGVGLVIYQTLAHQERWEESLARAQAGLANAGNSAAFTRGQLEGYIATVERLHKVSRDAAEDVVRSFTQISSVTPAIVSNLNAGLQGFMFLTGQAAPAAAAKLARAIEEPSRGIQELAQEHIHFSANAILAIDTLEREGDLMGARSRMAYEFATAMQEAARQMTPLQKEAEELRGKWLDLGSAFMGTSGHSTAATSALKALADILTLLRLPVAVLGQALWIVIDALTILWNFGVLSAKEFYGAWEAVGRLLYNVGATALQVIQGNYSTAMAIMKATPGQVAAEWSKAAGDIQANIDAIKKAAGDTVKPYWKAADAPGAPAPAPIPPGGNGGVETEQEKAERLKKVLDGILGTRRDLVQIGRDEALIQERRAVVTEQLKAATGDQRKLLESELRDLDGALKLEEQRRDAIERRDSRGDAGQVQTWRTELAERNAGEDAFHAMSNRDEAAFWQAKIALTEAGSKDRAAVEREYYTALARARSDDLRSHQDALKRAVDAQGASVEQRKQALEAYQVWATANLTRGTQADEASQNYILEKTRAIAAEEVRIRERAIDDQIRAEQRLLSARTSALDAMVTIGLLRQDQATAAAVAALDEEYRAEQTSLQRKLALNNLTVEDKSRITGQLQALDDRYNAAILSAATKAATAQGRTWSGIVDPITNAIDQSVNGILQGTQTANQVASRAASSIVTSYAQAGIKWVANWIRDELLATQATTAQAKARELIKTLSTTTDAAAISKATAAFVSAETAKTAASSTGAAQRGTVGAAENTSFFGRVFAQLGSWLGLEGSKTAASTEGAITRQGADKAEAVVDTTKALGQIEIAAAVAGANAYAAYAGLPPLAAAMAAEAVATVEGFGGMVGAGGAIASARGGWGQVPADGLQTELHKDEMVLPASIASPLRAILKGFTVPSGALSMPTMDMARNANGSFSMADNPSAPSGDTHVHFHGVLDARSFFHAHKAHIVSAVKEAHRNGAR